MREDVIKGIKLDFDYKDEPVKLYTTEEEIEYAFEEHLKDYTLHARARRARVLAMLAEPKRLFLAAEKTGQSVKVVKIKLMRLLLPNAEDSSEAEQRYMELLQYSGFPVDELPDHLRSTDGDQN